LSLCCDSFMLPDLIDMCFSVRTEILCLRILHVSSQPLLSRTLSHSIHWSSAVIDVVSFMVVEFTASLCTYIGLDYIVE